MATRIYLMPTAPDARGRIMPKYLTAISTWQALGSGREWQAVHYGPEPVCLIGITNRLGGVDDIHTTLTLNSDVFAVPADLDSAVGAQLAACQGALESVRIPNGWIQATNSWRTVLRGVLLVFDFANKFNEKLPATRLFPAGVTLDTRINQLPAGVRQALADAAQALGFPTGDLTGTSTLRTALKAMGDKYGIQFEFFAFTLTL